jgi:hypothetical protein
LYSVDEFSRAIATLPCIWHLPLWCESNRNSFMKGGELCSIWKHLIPQMYILFMMEVSTGREGCLVAVVWTCEWHWDWMLGTEQHYGWHNWPNNQFRWT